MKYKTTINGKIEEGTYNELIELINKTNYFHKFKIEVL